MTLEHLRSYYHLSPARSDLEPKEKRRPSRSFAHLPPGRLVTRASGSCYVTEATRDAGDTHGNHRYGELQDVGGAGLSVLTGDLDLARHDCSRTVILDTETTGLGVGAGTYVFLVGAGWYDGASFHLTQFFLPGPADESVYLEELHDFLSGFSTVITFNGKAFDWPLLESRYIRQRKRPPSMLSHHVDLLYPARRLWRERLESCALKDLEMRVLEVVRDEDDVQGWQIPEMYFRYQRTGDDQPLRRVLYHNTMDILSLAMLAVRMHCIVSAPGAGHVRHPEDFFALGRMYDRAGMTDNAVSCFEEASHAEYAPHVQSRALERLGALHKRSGDWRSAVRAWIRLSKHGGDGALVALVELAKYYEHVERDIGSALARVREAMLLHELREVGRQGVTVYDLEHRLRRLLMRNSRLTVTERAGRALPKRSEKQWDQFER
ncbi:MAG: ribonuclease H-like domain-containing protein [Chloroflexota bacterium]